MIDNYWYIKFEVAIIILENRMLAKETKSIPQKIQIMWPKIIFNDKLHKS